MASPTDLSSEWFTPVQGGGDMEWGGCVLSCFAFELSEMHNQSMVCVCIGVSGGAAGLSRACVVHAQEHAPTA
jgi:hypothetical protein